MELGRALSRPRPEVVQALRMTASSLAAFGLATVFGLPQAFWAVVSALIVTQGNIGGSLKAAFDRFVGSVCGAVYGGAIAFVIPHDNDLTRAAALAVAVAPLSILAASSAGFRVAPITAIIVLIGTAGATLGPLDFALDRILEVGLGCAVGLLASVLVAPARASHAVLDTAARVARQLAQQLEALPRSSQQQAPPDLAALVASTRKSLTGLETLIDEAARERRSRIARGPDPSPLLRTLLRLRHDVVMLRRAASRTRDDTVRDRLARPWSEAVQAGAARLHDLGEALAGRRPAMPSETVAEAAASYQATLDAVWRQGPMDGLPADEVGRLFGTGFALDQLRRNLDDLAERVNELAGADSRDTEI